MAMIAVAALESAGAERVVTVGGPDRGFGPSSISGLVPPHLVDRFPGEGPLGGLLTAFDAASPCEVVFLLSCDLPAIDAETVGRVLDALGDADADADAVVARSDRPQPLCAAYRRSRCTPVLSERFAEGARAMRDALAALDHVVFVDLPRIAPITNLNEAPTSLANDGDS